MIKMGITHSSILFGINMISTSEALITLPLHTRENREDKFCSNQRTLLAQVMDDSSYTQSLTPFSINVYFEAAIKFGSEDQSLMLVIDTGSSWMWVSADECADTDDCEDPSAFHYLLSDTYRPT